MLFRKKQPLVYIVDNNQSYRKVIAGCLEALDLTKCKLFNSGEQCFIDSRQAADIIVLEQDLGGSKWSGLEFMLKYKKIHPDTNFVFYTSNTRVETAAGAVRLGAVDYILKSKSGLSQLSIKLERIATFYRKKMVNKTIRNYLIAILILLSVFIILMSINYTINS